MSKNLIILVSIVLMIVVVLGIGFLAYSTINAVITDNKNANLNNPHAKAYSGEGISFNYPDGWDLSTMNPGSGIPGTKIISVNKIDISKSDNTNIPSFQVTIMPYIGLYVDMEGQNVVEPIASGPNFKLISNNTIKIDNETANELTSVYNDPASNKTMKMKEITFVKNGNFYSLLFEALDKDFDKEKSDFDIILTSFKVN